MKPSSTPRLVATTLAVGLAMTGCSKASGDSTTTASGGKPTIKLMVMGPVHGKSFSTPELPIGAQVAADQINTAGGIGGRKIEIVVCNDGNDPNEAVKCARQAVASKVTAMVGGFTTFEANVIPVTEAAGIPWVAASPLSNFTSRTTFVLGGDPASGFFGLTKALTAKGCKKAGAVAEDFAGAHQAEKLFQLGMVAAGGHYGAPVFAPQNAADFAPAVASAIGKGDDCIGIVSAPASAAKVIGAVAQSGKQITVGSVNTILPAQIISALGARADGVLSTSSFFPFTSDEPGIVTLKGAAQKLQPGGVLDDFVLTGYVAVKVVEQAAKGVVDLNAATLLAALPSVKGYDTGVGAVIDLSRPNPAKAFARIFNTKVYSLVARGGVFVLAVATPFETLPAFQAAAAAGQ